MKLEVDNQIECVAAAAREVHAVLGGGLIEPIYQDALEVEFELRNIPFGREVAIPLSYKGRRLPFAWRADFVCFGSLLVELKSLSLCGAEEAAQVRRYLWAGQFSGGVLLNFSPLALHREIFGASPARRRLAR